MTFWRLWLLLLSSLRPPVLLLLLLSLSLPPELPLLPSPPL